MSNLLISYPSIEKSDYEWIQEIRAAHDPRYFDVVEPHVTLVFPTDKLSAEQLKAHAQERLRDVTSFPVTFDTSIVVEDDSQMFFHNFLIPSQGYQEINRLHDLLYSGEMESELRHDIPFIPHIGIGTSDDRTDMDALAAHINQRKVRITGVLSKLTLAQFDGSKVTDLDTVILP